MLPSDPGPGYTVSTHMLNTAASFLNGEAEALAELRDAFNSSCDAAKDAFGKSPAANAFNEFFQAWFSAFDAQAETMGSVADATQQCAVVYDHAERQVLGNIPAMPTAPPPSRQPDIFGNQRPPVA
jgi:uncharacterized protein YukE